MAIKKVAVIGAGVMGAGIAAHLANAGYEVELLDRVDPKNPANRSGIAQGAIEKMVTTKGNQQPFMHKKNARKLRAGNTEDDIGRLKECDLIIEAVFEDPKVKSDIFRKIDANRKPGAIVASNTSTIPLDNLIADQSEAFKKDFVITHFFNPPRYMQLLELITSKHNSPELVKEVTDFMDEKLGKGVVACNDTPGFIANRIGTFWIQCSINEAFDRKLSIEEADAIVGAPMGIPKTGIFGLVDLVGLDLMPHISKSLTGSLPKDDGYNKIARDIPVISKMIADGFIGRKTPKGGFYRRDENKNDTAVDLHTGEMRPKQKAHMAAASNAKKAGSHGGLKALVETHDKGGDYAWSVLKQTLCYAAEHAHTIAADINSVDQAMKLGYNWKWGPFEMIDKLGVDYVINRLEKEGDKVPELLKKAAGKTFYKTENNKLQQMNADGTYSDIKRPEGVLLLSDIKRDKKNLVAKTMKLPKPLGQLGAALWDIGDGVLCLEFISPMNALDSSTMKMIHKACDIIEGGKTKGRDGQPFKALVIHNEAENFSLGANLKLAEMALKAKQFWVVDKLVKSGQDAYKRLKYAKFPVVSAPSGMALGGGCEILLHSHHVQAHAETYPGLVEMGVGLLPAWGGTTEMITRAKQNKKLPNGPMPAVGIAFETISTAKVALSAFEAKDLMYFRDTDGITMNKARLLSDAKKKALELTKDLKPEVPFDMQLPGPSGAAAIGMAVDGFYLKGQATPYDVVVFDKIANVMTGGDKAGPGVVITQDYLRSLEHANFMQLVHDPRTVARISHMMKTGKPLREPALKDFKRAQTIREEAEKPGLFARLFCNPVKNVFNKVCRRGHEANDNALKRDTKAQVNWPKIKKKP
ncbi:MAG: FAD-dependent oxidoreductase [Alphaproteobacteria bacterium]